MIKENIAHLDQRLADLERTIRDTRRVIADFRKAQRLHRKTNVLNMGALTSMATELDTYADAIRGAYQDVGQVYTAQEPLEVVL